MITAVILAHNDEKIVERVIISVKFCDEIIVVDDESEDGTVKLAEQVGAIVYKRRLNNDFAAQRNFGLSKARGEWVIFLDSDEIVTAKLEEEITQVLKYPISNIQYPINGYCVRRRDFIFERWLKHGETANVKLLRLARRNAGRWVRPVHEIWEVAGQIGELKNPLEHYPHQSVREFLTEINKYSSRNAKHLLDHEVGVNGMEIVLYPVGKFILNYIFRLGFLDGVAGFIVAMMMSMHSFLTRGKLYILWRDIKREKI